MVQQEEQERLSQDYCGNQLGPGHRRGQDSLQHRVLLQNRTSLTNQLVGASLPGWVNASRGEAQPGAVLQSVARHERCVSPHSSLPQAGTSQPRGPAGPPQPRNLVRRMDSPEDAARARDGPQNLPFCPVPSRSPAARAMAPRSRRQLMAGGEKRGGRGTTGNGGSLPAAPAPPPPRDLTSGVWEEERCAPEGAVT